jgi:hypothetical protein
MKSDDRKGADRVPPPAPWVESLLVHERVPPASPDLVRARLLARAAAAPRDPSAVPSVRADPGRVRRRFLAAAAGITLVAGVAAAFQMMRPASKLVPSSHPSGPPPRASRPADTDDAPAIAAPQESVAAAERAPGPRRRPSTAAQRDRGIDLGVGEIGFLDRAREADRRGSYTDVLAILDEHQRVHPAGRLSEEREVLRVKALAGLARSGEARRVAARFRQRYPRSVLLPKIDEILASLP